MRLYVDVNWDGNMDRESYTELVDDVADALIGVIGEYNGGEWVVASVGIQPPKVIRERGDISEVLPD